MAYPQEYELYERRKLEDAFIAAAEGRVIEGDCRIEPVHPQSPAMIIFRWLVFLPAAALASFLIGFIFAAFERIALSENMVNPDSFLSKLFITAITTILIGATFVYVGAKVAPIRRRTIAGALAAIGLIPAGIIIAMPQDSLAIVMGLSLMFGMCATALAVALGHTDL